MQCPESEKIQFGKVALTASETKINDLKKQWTAGKISIIYFSL